MVINKTNLRFDSILYKRLPAMKIYPLDAFYL